MLIYPPNSISPSFINPVRIFLAGSIEMGKATLWQEKFIEDFKSRLDGDFNYPVNTPFTFYNPRRTDWNASWEQNMVYPEFYQQVNWELEALEKSTHIVMFLEPDTLSPVSLLELGLFAASGKLLVVCPEGFWRKGNVDIVCNRYAVPQFNDLDEVLDFLVTATTPYISSFFR